jgi:putative ABC transport system substrate-binding protein
MDRRTFIGSVAGGLLAVPLSGAAQQSGKVPIVGILNLSVGPRSRSVDSTRQGLRELGYIEGQTIAFEVRFAGGNPERYPAFASRQQANEEFPHGHEQSEPAPT